MDKGEFDDKANMNSILNSTYDNDLGGSMIKSDKDDVQSEKSNNKSVTSKSGKKKGVVRRETNLSSKDQSIRSKDFSQHFQIQANLSDDEDDEDKTQAQTSEKEGEKDNSETIGEKAQDLLNDLGAAVLVDITDDKLKKQEEGKLLKYNNIYDKLRKKKDLIESLFMQRKFLAHFKTTKENAAKDLAKEMVLSYIEQGNIYDFDVEKVKGIISEAKQGPQIDEIENDDAQDLIEKAKQNPKMTMEEIIGRIKKEFNYDFEQKTKDHIEEIEKRRQEQDTEENSVHIKGNYTKQLNVNQEKIESEVNKFFDRIQALNEVCNTFSNISLFHKVLKGEFESIEETKEALTSKMNKLNDSVQKFLSEFEGIQFFGEAFDKEGFTKMMKTMQGLVSEQISMLYDIKLKEAQVVSCVMLQNNTNVLQQVMDDNAHLTLTGLCQKMVKILDMLLAEQNTVQKKWKNYLSDKETF